MENTYLLYDESKSCVIIDPGCFGEEEKKEMDDFINDNDLTVEKLLNTHCHIDHVLGNSFVKDKYQVSLFAHEIEVPYLKAVETYAPNYGYQQYQPSTIDNYINEGDIIEFGNSSLEILFVPGHSAGHIAFINNNQKICIGGDVLFKLSIGRTDLPGGDYDTLIKSIHTKLFKLSDDFVVYPGHGPTTTIEEEKRLNPFCALHLS